MSAVSDAKKLDGRQLEWQKGLRGLEDSNQARVSNALAQSISTTLQTLRTSYAKFQDSGGTDNRYTIERQTKLYRNLIDASEGLLGPNTLKQVEGIYKRDLKSAYDLGQDTSNDLRKIVEGDQYKTSSMTRFPIAAQLAAGERLKAFWTKERAELRHKVTEATLSALQTGKGWSSAQKAIADALRTDGRTILRGRDALSVAARSGIAMNLEQRAALIARTELADAYVQGQMAQYRKNGYSHGRWSATGERSCPFCASREGAIYLLEDLEGAIPAHPRCRCTVIPVMGQSVKRAQEASDQAVGAAQHLDDAGWAAIRQQRFLEFQKFTGKQDWQPGKYLRTPTSSEKFFKGANAEAVQPIWLPSGKVRPDLEAVAAATQRALQLEKDAKAAKDLEAQRKEAEKAQAKEEERKAAEAAAEEKKRIAELEAERARIAAQLKAEQQKKSADQKKADDLRGRLDRLNDQLSSARNRLVRAEDRLITAKDQLDLATVAAERAQIDAADAADRVKALEKAQKDVNANRTKLEAELAEQRKLWKEQEKILKVNADEQLRLRAEADQIDAQLAASKQKANSKKFDLDAYDSVIATQSHTFSSLKKLGEDTLRRAGVDLDSIKDFDGDQIAQIERDMHVAKVKIDTYEKRTADYKKEIKKLDKNWAKNEDLLRRTQPKEVFDQQKKIYEGRKENYQQALDQFPDAIARLKGDLDTSTKLLANAKAKAGAHPAQALIAELVRTSPLTKEQALKIVEDVASPAARKDAADKTRHSTTHNLKPVPKEASLEHMADAVQMFGTRSSMDAYGFSAQRAWAVGRNRSSQTGELIRMNFDGKTLSGLGVINSGGGSGGRFRQTQFHELGHHIEYSNSDIYRASREFIAERRVDDNPKWLGQGYGKDEIAYQAKRTVISPYALKEYDLGRLFAAKPEHRQGWEKGTDYTTAHRRWSLATEVTSMGLEHLATPATIQKLARIDSEHLLLAIGTVKLQQARVRNKVGDFGGDDLATKKPVTETDLPDGFAKASLSSDALKKQIEDLKSKRSDTFRAKTLLEPELEQKTAALKAIDDELKKLPTFDKVSVEDRKKRVKLKSRQDELNKLMTDYDEISQERTAARKEARRMEDGPARQKLDAKVDYLTQRLSANSKRQTELNELTETLQKDIENLKRNQTLRKDLEGERVNAEANLKAVKQQFETASSDFEFFRAKGKQLEKELEGAGGSDAPSDETKALQTQRVRLERKIKKLDAERSKIFSNPNDPELAVNRLENELAGFPTKTVQEIQLQKAKAKAAEAVATKKAADADLVTAKRKVTEREQEVAALKREIKTLESDITTTRKSLEQVKKAPVNTAEDMVDRAMRMKVKDVLADPSRFQYKVNANSKTGEVGSLSGVQKWNEDLAGVLSVWKDPANGKTYVINGHNRLALAKKLGAEEIPVLVINAKDAKTARSIGAKQNIANGDGSAIDAAKFMRDTGTSALQLKAQGLNLKGKVAADGSALAQLPDHIFTAALEGRLTIDRAAAIGRSGLSAGQMDSAYKVLKGKPSMSAATLDEVLANARASATRTTTEQTLFGASTTETSTLIERADLAAKVKADIAKEVRILEKAAGRADVLNSKGNRIDKGAAQVKAAEAQARLEVFELQKNRSGSTLNNALNEAAAALQDASGRSEKGKATKAGREAVNKAIDAEIAAMKKSSVGLLRSVADLKAAEAGKTAQVPELALASEAPDQTIGKRPVRLLDPKTAKAGAIGALKLDQIKADPKRFQYKAATDAATGEVGSLEGVQRFDANLAGVISVWKDPANGQTYVINGHNRLAAAKRLGAEDISVRYIKASSAEEARSQGALANIAEGHGTALDAAKFMRAKGYSGTDMKARGIAMKKDVARDGAALANLPDEIFDAVVDERISVEKASVIGSGGLDKQGMEGIYRKLSSRPAASVKTVAELVAAEKASMEMGSTGSLFAESAAEVAYQMTRADLTGRVRDDLLKEKSLFKAVSTSRAARDLEKAGSTLDLDANSKAAAQAETVLAVFDQLKNSSGPVASALSSGARDLQAAKTAADKNVIRRRVLDEISAAVDQELGGTLGNVNQPPPEAPGQESLFGF